MTYNHTDLLQKFRVVILHNHHLLIHNLTNISRFTDLQSSLNYLPHLHGTFMNEAMKKAGSHCQRQGSVEARRHLNDQKDGRSKWYVNKEEIPHDHEDGLFSMHQLVF